jgi:hypothetical protein
MDVIDHDRVSDDLNSGELGLVPHKLAQLFPFEFLEQKLPSDDS